MEAHRQFIADYLKYKKMSESTLLAALKNRDTIKNPSYLDFMSSTAPMLLTYYPALDNKRLSNCVREMRNNFGVDSMEYSFTSEKNGYNGLQHHLRKYGGH
jgi:hypothetical protein